MLGVWLTKILLMREAMYIGGTRHYVGRSNRASSARLDKDAVSSGFLIHS